MRRKKLIHKFKIYKLRLTRYSRRFWRATAGLILNARKNFLYYTKRFNWRRPLHLLIVLELLISVITPTILLNLMMGNRYVLAQSTKQLVGESNKDLISKLAYDGQKDQYIFNKDAVDAAKPQDGPDMQVGTQKDEASYGVELPTDPNKGVTVYDSTSKLSFTMTPDFGAQAGKQVDNHVVYPLGSGMQKIYTLKKLGLKEDIVINKPGKDKLAFTYTLNVPKSMEARLTRDGSLGIYSGDPTLFGNISAGTDKDKDLLQKARENGKKDHLVFLLPAPIIKEQGNDQTNPAGSSAKFELNGAKLTVEANNLKNIKSPYTIDPSVLIASDANFQYGGNNESGIDWDSTNNQIKQGALTGGSNGAWGSTTSYTTARSDFGAVAYNGYMYIAGGCSAGTGDCSAYLSDVQYAQICDGVSTTGGCSAGGGNVGKVGTWAATTSFSTPRLAHQLLSYNGYLYVLGGCSAGTCSSTPLNDVQYAKINSDGTIGSWITTSSFTTGRFQFGAQVSNGYMYVLGGCTVTANRCTGGIVNDIQYASIKADGTLSSWASAGTGFTTARMGFGNAVYNGRLYIYSGCGSLGAGNGFNCATLQTDVQYTPLNSNGTIGSWVTQTAASASRGLVGSAVYNGYFYMVAGGSNCTSSASMLASTRYASINADGSAQAGNANMPSSSPNDLPSLRCRVASVAYKGYLYALGGYDGTSYLTDVKYAAINSAGYTDSTWATSASLGTARRQSCGAIYNGYIYNLGGYNDPAANDTTTVEYAPLNADGTIGTWQTTQAMTTERHSCAAVAYNGYMYVLGGIDWGATVLNTVYYQVINANGSIFAAAWNAASSFTTARRGLTAVAYNGYMYIAGGYDGNVTWYADVQYAAINTNGSLGTWSTSGATTDLNRASFCTVAYAGYLYFLGGERANNLVTNSVTYGTVSGTSFGTRSNTNFMNTGRRLFGCGVYNGFMYVWGGTDNAGANISSTEYVKINSDGTLGTWTTLGNLPTARSQVLSGNMAYNGFLYSVGGDEGGLTATSRYTQINNGGYAKTGSWSSTTAFTTGRYLHSAIAYNGYLYILGGCSVNGCATYQGDVQYAPINGDGTVGSWNTTNSFTTARDRFSVGVYNGYMYIGGGEVASTAACKNAGTSIKCNDTQYAQINANGTLGSWTTTSYFSTPRSDNELLINDGYIYILGGRNATPSELSDVQYAQINTNGTLGSFTSTTSFTTAREQFMGIVYNGYMYVVGGTDTVGGTARADAQYAAINSNGTIGSWTPTTSMAALARWSFDGFAANGRIYAVGGYNAGNFLNDVVSAPINSNGTLGSWDASQSTFSTARYGEATTYYNGFAYMVGGCSLATCTGFQSDVQKAGLQNQPRIGTYSRLVDFNNNSPNYSPNSLLSLSGGTAQWLTGSTFTTGRNGNASIAYGGYLYVMGGCSVADCTTFQNDVQYAKINGDGSLGAWGSPGSGATFTTSRTRLAVAAYNGYMYLLGGCSAGNCTTEQSLVQYAQINGDGTLGSWTSTTSFTTARDSLASVAYNGFLYVLGGTSNGADTGDLATVQYAQICDGVSTSGGCSAGGGNAGKVGTWTGSTSFTTVRRGLGVAVSNGYMYIAGGTTTAGAALSDVQYGPISASGGVTSWTATTSFATGRGGTSIIAANNYLYIVGGNTATPTFLTDVQYAPINSTGTVGPWATSLSLPVARSLHGVASDGKNIYVVGGEQTVAAFNNTAYYTNIQNIGYDATPARYVAQGTDTGNPGVGGTGGRGGIQFKYKLANNTCTTFNSLSTLAFGLTDPLANPFAIAGTADGCSIATQNFRYAWVVFTIDDSQTATYPDVDGNHSTVSAIEFYFRSNTGRQLRNGKTFTNQIQNNLDAAP